MRPGQSSSEPRSAPLEIGGRPARGAAFLLGLTTLYLTLAAAMTPDGTMTGSTPASNPTPPAAAPAQRARTCPRCGYLCEGDWTYCARCGWDLRALVGKSGENRLESITHSVVRVVAVRSGPRMEQIL